jgi:hypothetical protein
MKRINVALTFGKLGYIGLPYWPETAFLIDLSKYVHPKLGPAKKEAAIDAGLEKLGKTRADYERALLREKRPFYTINDKIADQGDGEIIIPRRHFQSFLNNASQVKPKAIPGIDSKGMTFVGIQFYGPVDGFTTGKTKADAQLFSRFVKMEASNQRLWSESAYIAEFTARAVLTLEEEVISSADLQKLVEWGGKWIGIGSARPQGYGRFTVSGWDLAD